MRTPDSVSTDSPALPGTAESGERSRVVAGQTGQAAQGPISTPVSAVGTPLVPPTVKLGDSPAAALGRRTLSTAFVMVGPDGYLTLELRDGRVMIIRDVVMRRKDYCGTPVAGGRHCGDYAEVVSARAGGGPVTAAPRPTADPGGPERTAPRQR